MAVGGGGSGWGWDGGGGTRARVWVWVARVLVGSRRATPANSPPSARACRRGVEDPPRLPPAQLPAETPRCRAARAERMHRWREAVRRRRPWRWRLGGGAAAATTAPRRPHYSCIGGSNRPNCSTGSGHLRIRRGDSPDSASHESVHRRACTGGIRPHVRRERKGPGGVSARLRASRPAEAASASMSAAKGPGRCPASPRGRRRASALPGARRPAGDRCRRTPTDPRRAVGVRAPAGRPVDARRHRSSTSTPPPLSKPPASTVLCWLRS